MKLEFYEGKKVLITGHKGFIGSHLWSFIQESNSYGEWQNERWDLYGLDFPDDIGFFKPKEKYDYVIHLAAFAALRESFEDPDRFWENNVEKSKPIFDYCGENDVRLIYASSAGAHGWSQNPYAVTKKVNELQAPPNSVGMRFFNVWAEEGSRPDMLYRMLQENTAKYITRHYRDYIHVRDVSKAFLHAIDNYDRLKNEVFNVGLSEANLSKIELCQRIKNIVPQFVFFEDSLSEDPDKRNYKVSYDKINSIGFEVVFSISLFLFFVLTPIVPMDATLFLLKSKI